MPGMYALVAIAIVLFACWELHEARSRELRLLAKIAERDRRIKTLETELGHWRESPFPLAPSQIRMCSERPLTLRRLEN